MKTLYLHIGHYKTGTSALQRYLDDHAGALRRAGLLYPACARPRGNPTNHGRLALTLGRRHGFVPPPWFTDEVEIEDVWRAFREEAEAAPEPAVLISSEEFFQLGLLPDPGPAMAELKARLEGFEVRPVVYVREPFALLKSWYNEVNKGPLGTRNFIMFFRNLKPGFLGQGRVLDAYARTFGAGSLIVRAYRARGLDHVRGFLEALGTELEVEGDALSVNEGQSLELLELVRLSKPRGHDYDDATLTRLPSLAPLQEKVARIEAEFASAAARADAPIGNELTLPALFQHYQDLLRPAIAAGSVNDAEASILRDFALSVEETDLELARVLMRTAKLIRPSGPFIAGKLAAYDRQACA